MDRDGILRLAAALRQAAGDNLTIRAGHYRDLRERVFSYVGEDPDLIAIFPERPSVNHDRVLHGDRQLNMVAAYLRELAVRSPGVARIVASTDLMEQAEQLMDDKAIHVVAPIMLAGASLEEILRDLVEAQDIRPKGKPGLTTYAQALREADALSPNDVKEITSLAGIRNDAAHGDFDDLTRERAHIYLDRVNLMLQKLTSRPGASI